MENIDLYFLGMLVAIVSIALIDIVDSLNGVSNSFDKKEDLITVTVLVLCSWLSLVIIALIHLLLTLLQNLYHTLDIMD